MLAGQEQLQEKVNMFAGQEQLQEEVNKMAGQEQLQEELKMLAGREQLQEDRPHSVYSCQKLSLDSMDSLGLDSLGLHIGSTAQ